MSNFKKYKLRNQPSSEQRLEYDQYPVHDKKCQMTAHFASYTIPDRSRDVWGCSFIKNPTL